MTRHKQEEAHHTFEEILNKMAYVPGRVLVQELRSCVRCGETHAMLSFKGADRTDGTWTHWTLCPRTGDPILLLWKSEATGWKVGEENPPYEQK